MHKIDSLKISLAPVKVYYLEMHTPDFSEKNFIAISFPLDYQNRLQQPSTGIYIMVQVNPGAGSTEW